MRCFVGIQLPRRLSRDLAEACDTIRTTDERWQGEKWTTPPNLHLTLGFLGAVAEADIPELEERLGSVFAASQPFTLPFRRLSAHPNPRRCSMIWADFLDPSDRCSTIANGIADIAGGPDSIANNRHFLPHVTLARARHVKPLDVAALRCAAETIAGDSRVMSVLCAKLFSSTLTRHGPVYEVLRTWPLSGV